ncbi:pyruvate kinase [Phaeocystidibacter marisrubri]|uniref:Pyruvate kinase n=1 Tax=Phaeocystidibacter marisrubri TaxID=1577780 RepID=A0A6L3ZGQ6_9FLAO|nr:pyruvate kinase [Phaeocystidibacter marisrubri]KAB2816514.1 pyruvate kinase [Phaeocystidibacter marisrubri]GGH69441.1 pyruvate kinase [Phaeocystidibacter marisrubri]
MNRAKIVATLGPASANKETMLSMIKAGVNVFRINFSHGDHETHRKTIRLIREINEEFDYNIATLADLQGPKLRVGDVEEGAIINVGDTLTFTTKETKGTAKKVFMTYERFPQDVQVGERILLDDGKLLLTVKKTNGEDEVEAEVVQGGPLKSKKGVNLPNTKISLPCLTEKDLADLEVALEENVEWIGLSFVRNAEDVIELKRLIRKAKKQAFVISKIEKPEAVMDIDRILEETDGVMVARGDLGVEVPMQSVPLIQKMITEKALMYSKPVIIATQMMETMIENMSPTRAEVNDVANSVLDGADAVMLSGETSVGKHPIAVVEAMSRIISHVEESAEITAPEHPPLVRDDRYITDSICYHASKVADSVSASAIMTMTFSGYTAFKISSHRPKSNVFVFTANRSILNTLSLLWGVHGFYYDKMESTDNTFHEIKELIRGKKLMKKGELMVKIASMPIQERGFTNMLKIAEMD